VNDANNRLPPDENRAADSAAAGSPEPSQETLTAAERTFLLDLARATLVRVATSPNSSDLEVPDAGVPVKLRATKACFVTLTKKGSLRGCIGQLLPQEPLFQAVIHNARNAATRDPRFSPVQPHEVDDIKIEISVLTQPQPLNFRSPEDLLEKLKPSEDGVVLTIGSRKATFLPQVWTQLPDKVQFLNQLSRKTGSAPAAWRGGETSVSTYRVEAFGEAG
jgi:AmmeMemoRadiSam system protein A